MLMNKTNFWTLDEDCKVSEEIVDPNYQLFLDRLYRIGIVVPVPSKQLFSEMGGRRSSFLKNLRIAVAQKIVQREGRGCKRDPYLYSLGTAAAFK